MLIFPVNCPGYFGSRMYYDRLRPCFVLLTTSFKIVVLARGELIEQKMTDSKSGLIQRLDAWAGRLR